MVLVRSAGRSVSGLGGASVLAWRPILAILRVWRLSVLIWGLLVRIIAGHCLGKEDGWAVEIKSDLAFGAVLGYYGSLILYMAYGQVGCMA